MAFVDIMPWPGACLELALGSNLAQRTGPFYAGVDVTFQQTWITCQRTGVFPECQGHAIVLRVGFMRYPSGTPYIGPAINYDAVSMTQDEMIARLAYSKPRPMLRPRQRMDAPFFGRLLAQLANCHVALVKILATERSAYRAAHILREELGIDRYEVGVRQDPDLPMDDEWFVLVYNRITRQLQEPSYMRWATTTETWVDTQEAARVLRCTTDHARKLAHKFGVPTRRDGGRNQVLIRQSDLLLLANRPRAHRKGIR
jgi:hypothetical protein